MRNLRKFCSWNPESWALESDIQLKESGIPLTTRIWNPSFTDNESEIQYLESVINGVESKIQGCLGFPLGRGKVTITKIDVKFVI